MYVHVYVCVCVCICMYISLYIYIYVYVYISCSVCICICIYMMALGLLGFKSQSSLPCLGLTEAHSGEPRESWKKPMSQRLQLLLPELFLKAGAENHLFIRRSPEPAAAPTTQAPNICLRSSRFGFYGKMSLSCD